MWLERCIKSHSACNSRRADKHGYPARLLDLGLSPKQHNLCLVETHDIRKPVTYLTLSHCWGGTNPLMLKCDNINRFKDHIDMEELPKSFKDAICTARHLSVRYLWIDSLCIIQDSYQDWELEAAKIKGVYTNSLLTIAATGAENSTQGFDFQRDPILVEPIIVNMTLPSPYCGVYALYKPNTWRRNIDFSSLNQRAWFVQERLLSPCVLHFGRDQIAWECQELQACETFPAGLPKYAHYYGDPRCKALMAPNRGNVVKRWKRIVHMYSRCRLTRESDICIAFAGVAEEFQSSTSLINDTYVAGFWGSCLLSQLCWAIDSFENRAHQIVPTRPLRYRAPSWSWMSIKSTISFYDFTEQSPLFTILDYKVKNMSDNRFGAIEDGFISGCGLLKHTQWCYSKDSGVKELLIINQQAIIDGCSRPPYGFRSYVTMDLGSNQPPCEVACVPLIKATIYGPGYYIGLILTHVARQEDVYQRIGYFRFEPKFGDRVFMHKEASNEGQTSLSKSTFTII